MNRIEPTDRDVTRKSLFEDPPVYRHRPLPTGALEGEFLIPEPMIGATREALTSFAIGGMRDGGHEGLVYWVGRELGELRVLLSVVVPRADTAPQRVMVTHQEVARTARAARAHGTGILCQVHSHPGSDARHSDGDDDLVLLPFEGMLSVVAPNYGIHLASLRDLTFHQYQRGRWVLCLPDSVAAGITVIPTAIDLR